MIAKFAAIGALGLIMLSFPSPPSCWAESPMSSVEALVFRLATADLSSEKHTLPGNTLSLFANWMDLDVLKDEERSAWTITTVRKSERFEFIHAETDGLTIRQLPEVFMIGFTPKSPKWRETLAQTVLEFLRSSVQGDWGKVKADPPKTVGGTVFVESAGGGFSHRNGTIRDSFVAVVVDNKVWVCLPKRRDFGGAAGWFFSIDDNKRWFSRYPRQL